jgi:hypothetical protein
MKAGLIFITGVLIPQLPIIISKIYAIRGKMKVRFINQGLKRTVRTSKRSFTKGYK